MRRKKLRRSFLSGCTPLPAGFTPHLPVAWRLLSACLAGTPDPEQLSGLLSRHPAWDEVFTLAQRHGVLPLLYQGLKDCPDARVPGFFRERLREWFAAHALRCLQMQRELQGLVDLLTRAGIAVIPFKGPTLAIEVYVDPALRSFVDLDLLVPPHQAWPSLQLLLASGYSPGFVLPPERWPGLQRTENHLTLTHPDHPWSVELHWALFHPMYPLPFDLAAHWSTLAGGGQGRLDREETLVMLCAHGTKHLWAQLKWLVDIDRLLRGAPPPDWPATLLLAGRAKSKRALLLGLSLARAMCGTPLDDQILARIEADTVVGALTETLLAGLVKEHPGRSQPRHEYAVYLQSRDTFADRLQQILHWLCWPRLADWQVFPPGDRCHALYFFQRPTRMLWKWLVLPMLGRHGDGGRRTGD